MSTHQATVRWHRSSDDFTYKSYNRAHEWEFSGDLRVPASAAPAYRGDSDRGDSDRVDPEEAFVASVSACHMLTFLALAARKRFVVERYTDRAEGVLEKNEDGRLAITRVALAPEIEFGGEKQPSDADLAKLHELAHKECFIANSIRASVAVRRPERNG
jgi:organic hydroperoxide reductase OsmC/OhrA